MGFARQTWLGGLMRGYIPLSVSITNSIHACGNDAISRVAFKSVRNVYDGSETEFK